MTVELDKERRALILAIEAELRRRLLVVPRRPDGFNALRAEAEELALYGLPPKPKPGDASHAIWRALVGTPPQAEERIVSDLPLRLPGFDYQLNYNRLGTGAHQQTSRNWSGAVAAARSGAPFVTVYGRWQVPRFRAPAGAPNGVVHACSTWIGLDGHRRVSKSLPQIGTTQSVSLPGPPQVEAWWQWWMRGHRNPPMPFANFPVDQGDEVVCSLEVREPFRVVFNIANLTKQVAAPPKDVLAPFEFTPPYGPNPPSLEFFPVRGVAAEWIAERPTVWNGTALYPLPDFDPVSFDPCLAAAPPSIRGLGSARLIRMVEARTAPPRAAVLSRPRKRGTYRVDVTYRA